MQAQSRLAAVPWLAYRLATLSRVIRPCKCGTAFQQARLLPAVRPVRLSGSLVDQRLVLNGQPLQGRNIRGLLPACSPRDWQCGGASSLRHQMATIKDVARLAEVSTATVSAAINGTAYVSPQLKERVERAISELGYSHRRDCSELKEGRDEPHRPDRRRHDRAFLHFPGRGDRSFGLCQGYTLMLCHTGRDVAKETEVFEPAANAPGGRHHLVADRAR